MTYGPFAVSHCQRCGNTLLYREYKLKQWYCSKCAAVINDEKHREQVADSINNANRRGRMV